MKVFTAIATLLASFTLTAAQIPASNNNYIGVSPAERHIVNATQAQAILEGAVQAASTTVGVPMNIAVVDPFGLLVAFFRMDSACKYSSLTAIAHQLPMWT